MNLITDPLILGTEFVFAGTPLNKKELSPNLRARMAKGAATGCGREELSSFLFKGVPANLDLASEYKYQFMNLKVALRANDPDLLFCECDRQR